MKQNDDDAYVSPNPVEAKRLNKGSFEVSKQNLVVMASNSADSLDYEHAQDHSPEQFERVNLHNQNFQSISATFKNEISHKQL
jgi:hypothetical protein